jgi:hypothetical protein
MTPEQVDEYWEARGETVTRTVRTVSVRDVFDLPVILEYTSIVVSGDGNGGGGVTRYLPNLPTTAMGYILTLGRAHQIGSALGDLFRQREAAYNYWRANDAWATE